MEEAKSLAQQQQHQQHQHQHQHQLMLQQHHHQQQQQQHHNLQQQQQLLLLQQIQLQQHQQQAAAAGLTRFPSSNHFRSSSSSSPSLHYPLQSQHQQITINPNPNPNHPIISNHLQNPNPNPSPSASSSVPPKLNRSPAELQMSYQDLWRVCHPDYKRPFSSLQDACERLLPYHVVADYEAEEDDRILDSDTTGQMLSRSQQWDHNIAAKVAEFAATFEKQVFAFNIISRKRALGEFRLEERLLIENLLLQEEKESLGELRKEMESRQNAGREANLRMAAIVHAEKARAESQAYAEMMARGPIRPNALGSQGSNIQIGHDITDQEQEVNPEEMINGWGSNAQRDEKEPSEDFLNDEETENGDAGMEEFDLNTR